jgi:hypothetical protein
MDLGHERVTPAIKLASPLRRRFQRVEGERQALAGELDGITVAHSAILAATSAAHHT